MTHLKWSQGNVDSDLTVLPYHDKVPGDAKSSPGDANLTCRTGNSTPETHLSPTPPELTDPCDAWTACGTEESEAFWVHGVNDRITPWTGDEDVASDAKAASESDESKPSERHAVCSGNVIARETVAETDETDEDVSDAMKSVNCEVNISSTFEHTNITDAECDDMGVASDDSDTEAAVVDETDDASQSTSQTVMTTDPCPVNECLLLSLEEVLISDHL